MEPLKGRVYPRRAEGRAGGQAEAFAGPSPTSHPSRRRRARRGGSGGAGGRPPGPQPRPASGLASAAHAAEALVARGLLLPRAEGSRATASPPSRERGGFLRDLLRTRGGQSAAQVVVTRGIQGSRSHSPPRQGRGGAGRGRCRAGESGGCSVKGAGRGPARVSTRSVKRKSGSYKP